MLKRNEILALTRETLESSSIHAIPNITKNKFLIIKFIWTVCFILSISICSLFIQRTISDYFNYEVVSNIQIKYKNKVEFPIIGICLQNLIKSNELNEMLKKITGSNKPSLEFLPVIQTYSRNRYINNTLKDDLKISDLVIRCKFNAYDCNLTNDFVPYYDFNYGTCFRFNSGKNVFGDQIEAKMSYQTGLMNGLILELFFESADQNRNLLSISNGLNIFINSKPYDSTFGEGIDISAGTKTKIIINRNIINKQPKPYSDCISDLTSLNSYSSELYKKTFLALNNSYEYSICKLVCIQKIFYHSCSCQVSMNLIYYKDSKDCFSNMMNTDSLLTISKCLSDAYLNFTKDESYMNQCNCPMECEKLTYSYQNSFSEFPTLQYSSYMMDYNSTLINSNMTYQELKKRVARIEIFYDELKETVFSETIKIDSTSLISNVGGTIGLFLGFSFLSLIEFVEIILQIILVLIKKETKITSKIHIDQ